MRKTAFETHGLPPKASQQTVSATSLLLGATRRGPPQGWLFLAFNLHDMSVTSRTVYAAL